MAITAVQGQTVRHVTGEWWSVTASAFVVGPSSNYSQLGVVSVTKGRERKVGSGGAQKRSLMINKEMIPDVGGCRH